MRVWLCVAERSGPQCYAALHRCAGSIHQCPATWQAEQCSTLHCCDGSTAQTLTLCSHSGCQARSDHDPFRSNTHPLAQRERLGVTHYPELQELICEKELGLNITKGRDKRYLSHTQPDNEGFFFIHCPLWLMDIKIYVFTLWSVKYDFRNKMRPAADGIFLW